MAYVCFSIYGPPFPGKCQLQFQLCQEALVQGQASEVPQKAKQLLVFSFPCCLIQVVTRFHPSAGW